MTESKLKTQVRLILSQNNIFEIARTLVDLHDKSVRSKQVHDKFIEYINEVELEHTYHVELPLRKLFDIHEFNSFTNGIKELILKYEVCPLCGGSIISSATGKICGGCEYVF